VSQVVIFHLLSGSVPEVEALLRSSGFGEGYEELVFPISDDPVLYARIYSGCDELREASEEDYDLLLSQLGREPVVEVFVDIPYRHAGTQETRWLAGLLLAKFGGAAIDEYVAYDHAWSLDEIQADTVIDGHRFFRKGP